MVTELPNSSKRVIPAVFLALLVVVLAVILRVPGLEHRPMHTDEAVHGVMLGELMEDGRYVYDPSDYHGPTMYFATFPVLWFSGASTSARAISASPAIPHADRTRSSTRGLCTMA